MLVILIGITIYLLHPLKSTLILIVPQDTHHSLPYLDMNQSYLLTMNSHIHQNPPVCLNTFKDFTSTLNLSIQISMPHLTLHKNVIKLCMIDKRTTFITHLENNACLPSTIPLKA